MKNKMRNKTINIITACSRPENLSKVYDSLQGLKCNWFIILDDCKDFLFKTCSGSTVSIIIKQSKKKGEWCGSLKNEGLEMVKTGWIYVLDDDNLLHPDFKKSIQFYIDKFPQKKAFVFNQALQEGIIRKALHSNIRINYIDQAQYLVHKELIGDIRYPDNEYQDDGIFIEALYQFHSRKFLCIKKTMCYYNKLKW
jgi:hypothetical protein